MFGKKSLCFILLIILFTYQGFGDTENSNFRFKDNPYIAGALSMVFPGSGYFFLGEPLPGLLSAAMTLPLPLGSAQAKEDFLLTAGQLGYLHMSNGLYLYSIYDTFQTGLDLQGRPKQQVSIPHYSFTDLLSAPVNPKTYDFKYSSSAIAYYAMYALPIGITAYNIINRGFLPTSTSTRLSGKDIDITKLLIAIPLIITKSFIQGMGEEAFYKGYLMPAAAALTNNKAGGNIIQAVHFGFSHTSYSKNIPLLGDIPLGTTSTYNQKLLILNDGVSLPTNINSSASNAEFPELGYFLLYTLAAYYMGDIVLYEKDGLLKAAAYNSLCNTIVLLGDILTKGYIDTFYFEVSFSLY